LERPVTTDERYDGNSLGHSGMTKGPRRHKETWWWNEDVAEAVREKKIKYGKWKRENTKEARMEYKKSRQNAKRVISSAKEKKQK